MRINGWDIKDIELVDNVVRSFIEKGSDLYACQFSGTHAQKLFKEDPEKFINQYLYTYLKDGEYDFGGKTVVLPK